MADAKVQYIVEVKSDLEKLQKQLDDTNKKLARSNKQGAETSKSMAGLTSAFKAVGGAMLAYLSFDLVKDFFLDTLSAASDLEEAMSKSEAVFGSAAREVQAFADTAAVSIGQSRSQALEAAGTFGNLLIAFGLTTDKAQEMSVEMVKLASDLASFNNTSVDDALLAIRSGLSGETEPLKRFGVALTDARLKAVALDMGLIETAKGTLPANIKAMAAYQLILEDTSLAQGDFARTSEGMANQQRIQAALWEDIKANAAEAYSDEVTGVLGTVNALLVGVSEATAETEERNRSLVREMGLVRGYWEAVNMTIADGRRVLNANREVTDDFWLSQLKANGALEESESLFERASGAQRDYTESLLEHEAALVESEDAELKWINANIRAEEKLDALNEAVDEHGEGSREARKAQLEYNASVRDAVVAESDYIRETQEAKAAQDQLTENDAALAAINEIRDAWNDAAQKVLAYRSAAQTALATADIANRNTGGVLRHSGGPIHETGDYRLMRGEHVMTAEQMQSINNSQSISVTVNAGDGASGAVIATAVRAELESILNSSAVRAAS